ncbi:MAG: BamA/TamA family outer membrane protein [Paracoccaceae bacterium]|jgi:translocation and assembly module TamA|nr:BamA/TamA family outer membrane protein [Paracoccaceae bacterium]
MLTRGNSGALSRALLAGALGSLLAAPVAALDRVVVRAPGAEESLARLLERASTTARARSEAEAADRALSPEEAITAARAEYREMTGALFSEGYYGGTVTVSVDGREAADISILNPPARVREVVVTVEPGPRFRFSRAEVTPPPPGTPLPEGYAAGEIARSGLIRQAGRAGVEGWRGAGHAKVVLTEQRIQADHPRRTLSSELVLDTGPRLRFGDLVVRGNERVRTDRILAIAGLPTGEVYDPDELDDAAARLRRTGAFRAVSLNDAETVRAGDVLDIEAQLVEQAPRRIGAGAELSSSEGLALSAFWMHRNLLGGAENLRFDLEVQDIGAQDPDNGIDYFFTTSLVRPATPITDMDLLLGIELESEDEPGYLANNASIGGGFAYRFSDRLRWASGLRYRFSDVEDAFGERSFQMLVFPNDLTFDTRDSELDPTRGVFAFGSVRPFVGVSGIENGAQVRLDGRTYLGLGEDRRTVLAGRMQLGSLFGPDIPDAPPDYLFFAGGGGTVRGQPYDALGSGEVDGTIVGGRSFVGFSAEARAYVRGPIGVVGFYDAGYIGAEEFYDGSGEWIGGAGLGVRYDTGFGPIRLDVAVPVDDVIEDADPVQIYIGIGQAF